MTAVRWHELPPAERFWLKVEKTATCWLWTGGRGFRDRAYGIVRWEGVATPAHRVAFLVEGLAIPRGFDVHHVCEVKLCVRVHPDHLIILPHGDHSQVSHPPGAFCKYGHPMSGENLGIVRTGKNIGMRYCKACNRRKAREHQRRYGWHKRASDH